MIPLMRSTFYDEVQCKKDLAEFIIKSKRLSMDEQCYMFEQEFKEYQGSKYSILFNSGGSANLALIQSLLNLGKLSKGDKVGFSALTWSTNVMPIIQLGLEPVIVDCDVNTINVMSHNLEDRLKDTDLKAFFITNALGFAGDLKKIKEICDSRNIILLEDNCESFGTELEGGKSGSFGLGSSFSFYVAHHMSTIEGGMVATDDPELDKMLRIVRANGWDRNLNPSQQQVLRDANNIESEFQAKYVFYDLGFNIRPTEITGFLGRYQLKFMDKNVKGREKNHVFLEEAVKNNDDIYTLDRSHIKTISAFAFPVICKTKELKDKYSALFEKKGVEIRPVISGNMQKQPFYKKYVKKEYKLIGADRVHECGFYCGNYLELTEDELETIKSCLSGEF